MTTYIYIHMNLWRHAMQRNTYAMDAMHKAGSLSNATIPFHSDGPIYSYPTLISLGLVSLPLSLSHTHTHTHIHIPGGEFVCLFVQWEMPPVRPPHCCYVALVGHVKHTNLQVFSLLVVHWCPLASFSADHQCIESAVIASQTQGTVTSRGEDGINPRNFSCLPDIDRRPTWHRLDFSW